MLIIIQFLESYVISDLANLTVNASSIISPIFLCHGQKKRGNVNLKSAQKQLWSLQKKIHKQHLDRWRSKDMTWTDEWKNIYVIWTCTPMMSRPG